MSRARLLDYLVDQIDQVNSSHETPVKVADLTDALGVPPTVVTHWVAQLAQEGVQINILEEHGLLTFSNLPRPLSSAKISSALAPIQITISAEMESTNSWVVEQLASTSPRQAPDRGVARDSIDNGWVVATDVQSSGRGTRGRQWLAPPWRNIAMTYARAVQASPADLSGLSLAVGVCAAQVLSSLCTIKAQVKWPNDVVVEDRKLAGILIETVGLADDKIGVVIGVGINVDLGAARGQDHTFEYPVVDLRSVAKPPYRETLIIELTRKLDRLLAMFPAHGFRVWHEAFRGLDVLKGRLVDIQVGRRTLSAVVAGVNCQGHLLVETATGEQAIASGKITRWRRE